MEKITPFGLNFAETPIQEIDFEDIEVFYDEDASISFIVDENGQRQPFVLWAWQSQEGTKTVTVTSTNSNKDTDQPPQTGTATKSREDNDSD